MTRIAAILIILFCSVLSFGKQSCIDLFYSPQDLIRILGYSQANSKFKLYSEAAEKFFENFQPNQPAHGPRAQTAMAALKAASFQGRKARAIHQGLIEKRAAVLMERLEELYDQPDAFGGDKRLVELKRAARESLYIAGVKMLAEQAGFDIIPNWSFRSFYATRTTIWWNVIKPFIRAIMIKFPNRKALFTEEDAMDVLWAAQLDPQLLLDNSAIARRKLTILKWWNEVGEHSPQLFGTVITIGFIAYGSFVYGKIDSATLAGHAKHVDQGIIATMQIKSLQADILNDDAEAIYQKVLEDYLAKFPGKTKADIPKNYKDEAKAFIRLGDPEMVRYKFSDDPP